MQPPCVGGSVPADGEPTQRHKQGLGPAGLGARASGPNQPTCRTALRLRQRGVASAAEGDTTREGVADHPAEKTKLASGPHSHSLKSIPIEPMI